MIIGISGKKQSGKDTVGKIIQYLTLSDYSSVRTNQLTFEKCTNIDLVQSNWRIVKFADKVKDIVCIIIGCTREQLEDEEFKNTPLGIEWNYSYSGHQIEGFHRIAGGDKILTPRMLLQQIGTDVCRNIHPNMWINATMREYIDRVPSGTADETKIWLRNNTISNWIITDVRFPNEYYAITDRGGIVIRVNRPCPDCGLIEGHKMIPHSNKSLAHEHPSETALDDTEFDYTIDNNGTINDLIHNIKNILIQEKII